MLCVLVYVEVKPEFVDAFREASLENQRHSVQERGVARFEVVQSLERPEHFVLIEVYRDEAAPAEHKATGHYQRWRDRVEPMMAVPRRSAKYTTFGAE